MTSQNSHGINNSENKTNRFRCIGAWVAKAIMGAAAVGAVFWLLWNWAAVPLFTFPALTYLQALVAILLTGFLVRMAMCAAGRHRRQPFSGLSPSRCWHHGCKPRDTHGA